MTKPDEFPLVPFPDYIHYREMASGEFIEPTSRVLTTYRSLSYQDGQAINKCFLKRA